jgi:hypothetical protein
MYKLTKHLDSVYLVQFEESYDLAMTFLRYQEFYECANEDIRGKQFTLLQFMDWYVKEVNEYDSFSYHLDWSGFNIPSTTIQEVRELGILDMNHYDARMFDIYDDIRRIHGDSDFYLIGTSEPTDPEDTTLEHELAHGLYYTNEQYRIEMNENWDTLSTHSKVLLADYLTETGYPEKVHIDEVQAYLSTGALHLNNEISKKVPQFRATLRKYLTQNTIN